MSEKTKSAVQSLVMSVCSVLVARGVIGGETADQVQTILLAAIPVVAALAIRSLRPPRV
jgi:hypothetical protein